jgi:hypothetical protein
MTKLKGNFSKTTEGHETYDIYHAEAEHIFPVATMIEKKFGFKPLQLPIFALDSAYIELIRNDVKIIVGWDIWSGLFVMSTDIKGDTVVHEIGEYLYTQEIND